MKTQRTKKSWQRVVLILAVSLVTALLPRVCSAQCGCLDVALCVDDTGSMGGAIASVKAGLTNIIAAANSASGGDVRFALITFLDNASGIQQLEVDQPFTADIAAMTLAVNAVTAGGGAGAPEASDEMLQLVATGAPESCITVVTPKGPLGTFRGGCGKIAVLITDAEPAGCDDTYTPGVDDVHAATVASNAASASVFISAILVGADPIASRVMSNYAAITGGFFTNVPPSGAGTGEGISSIIAKCGGGIIQPPPPVLPTTQPPAHPFCITRNSLFWFTNVESTDPTCATLRRAIQAAGEELRLGFLGLPTDYRNNDNVKDGEDALIEALGLYWRSLGRTGEDQGLQSAKLPASRVCKARKQLAVELVAAIANNALLGTGPANCALSVSKSVTNYFPSDLIDQAGVVVAGDDFLQMKVYTALLKKFNKSGVLSQFVGGLVTCSPWTRKAARAYSQDPTTQVNCGGLNDSPSTAEPITIFPFSERVDLSKYSAGTNSLPGSPCGAGGPGAVWKITPTIAVAGSQFTIDSKGSNISTLLTVFQTGGLGFISVACDNPGLSSQARVSFTADGATTYYIVGQGQGALVGSLRVRVTSP